MTRDQALEVVRQTNKMRPAASDELWMVCILENLGVLKFDEPKPVPKVGTAYDRAFCTLHNRMLQFGDFKSVIEILDTLGRANLEIVEKKKD